MNAEEAATWLRYDPLSGQLTWKVARNRRRPAGSPAGSVWNRRLHIMIAGRKYFAHRLAWLLTHGEWPDGEIDHINGDPLDNRIENLRVVTHAVNTQNLRRARSNSTTGLLGVGRTKSKRNPYVAYLVIEGKTTVVGRFNDPHAAHAAYVQAKRIHHKGNTL